MQLKAGNGDEANKNTGEAVNGSENQRQWRQANSKRLSEKELFAARDIFSVSSIKEAREIRICPRYNSARRRYWWRARTHQIYGSVKLFGM